ncbi:insulinase family protein [Omnitrophica bacterium]|nr:insulinase family protein [Candidatus Omnitrophota bacterium]
MNYFLSTLPNGVRVVTVPMQERDSASVAIWVQTGGRFESKKESGISHVLEHMLFKGTKRRTTRQIKEEIEGVGGVLNAFTSEEVTCYFAKLLKEHYPRALDVLSDMVNHATLDGGELMKEKTVILEEIKMYRDLPAHHVHELLGELLWRGHPLGRPIAGTVESVAAMTRKQVVEYKKRYYQPKNILVSVSGPVQHYEVLDLVKRHFPQTGYGRASKFQTFRGKQSVPRAHFMEKDTEQTHFALGLHGYSKSHPDRYSLGLLNIILGANMSSRLFEQVREKRGLAYEIRSSLSFYQDTGAVTISAGVETKKTAMTLAVILKELEKLKRKPVTDGELRRAKDYFMSQLYLALEDTLDHVLWVGERALEKQELPDPHKIRQRIEAVSRESILQTARKLFVTSNLNFSLIGPVHQTVQARIRRDLKIG